MDSFYLSISWYDYFLILVIALSITVAANALIMRYNKSLDSEDEENRIQPSKAVKYSLGIYLLVVLVLTVWFVDRKDSTGPVVIRSFDHVITPVEIPKTEVVAPNRESVRSDFTKTVEEMENFR